MAYPIYLTIGNIPKDTHQKLSHHAQMLTGYILTTKLPGISNKAAHCHVLANLFHACMYMALGPITYYGETGIPIMSGNGIWCQCHPILAAFVSDYPEQMLVNCTYNRHCPKCTVTASQLSEYKTFPLYMQKTAIDTYLLISLCML
jgi:hypothetical protein